jgi:hypothetical protein
LRYESENFIEWGMRVVEDAIKRQEKIESFKRNYENPRGLPEAWIDKYLGLDNVQLAIDVIKAFDKNYQLERTNAHLRMTLWVMSLLVSPLLGEVVKLLFHQLLK